MKMSDIRELSDEELVHTEFNIERELVEARFKKQLGTLENPSVFSGMRKSIARLRTEQRKREIANNLKLDELRNTHRKTFVPDSDSSKGSAASGEFLKGISEKLNQDD